MNAFCKEIETGQFLKILYIFPICLIPILIPVPTVAGCRLEIYDPGHVISHGQLPRLSPAHSKPPVASNFVLKTLFECVTASGGGNHSALTA